MHSVDSDGVILRLRHAVQVHPATADRLDMRRPWIDQRDVVTKGREVRADITADRTGADEGDALAHSVVSSPKVLSLRVPYWPLADRLPDERPRTSAGFRSWRWQLFLVRSVATKQTRSNDV